ncbi:MAG: DUF2946 family protein [Hyphomonadaceae bacterium]
MGGIRHTWRAAGLLLAVIALALRVAVPAGFMLANDGHHRLTVTLCSSMGPVEAVLDLATGKLVAPDHAPKPGGGEKNKAPCAFAALNAPAAGAQGVSIAAPHGAAVLAPRTPRAERPSLQPAGPPLPARGPPLFA